MINLDDLADMMRRARRAGKISPSKTEMLSIIYFQDGTTVIQIGEAQFGGIHKSLSVALDEFEAALTRDEAAEVNATLGITT